MRDITNLYYPIRNNNLMSTQHINDILNILSTSANNKGCKNLNITHIPNNAWSPDRVELLASMNSWTTDMSNRGSNSRDSIVGQNFEHLRRLRLMYGGLQYKDILHLSKKSSQTKGLWSHNLIALLERRLDVVIWRALWANSPKQARSIIKSGYITVNGKVCTQSSFSVNPGDLVSISYKVRKIYQQKLIDSWSHIPPYRIEDFNITKNATSTSVIDIMQRALYHGRVVDTNELNLGSLGYINYSPSKSHGAKSLLTGISQTAQNVLLSINNDKEFNKVIWSCVLRGVYLEYEDKNSTIFPCIMPHIEVNYNNMSLVYLYTPQRVLWTSLIDLEALQNYLV
jgi:ribosomal protein S4